MKNAFAAACTRPCRPLFASVLLAAPAFAGDVHKVDPTDAAAFASIHEAVAAAAPGDVIVVHPKPEIPGLFFTGLYPSFTVDKSLTIIAEEGVLVRSKAATIRDLGPSDTVALRGLQFERAMPALGAVNLRVDNSRGTVLIEDCVFRISIEVFQPLVSVPPVPSDPAVEVLGPLDGVPGSVTFVRCRIDGTDGATQLTPGPAYGFQMQAGVGLRVEGLYVALWDCVVRGGKGQPGGIQWGLPGGDGGDAVTVDPGFLFVSNSTLTGGDGGPGIPSTGTLLCVPAGDGGRGIFLPNATVQTLDSTRTGGGPGAPGDPCPGGTAGLPDFPQGLVQDFAGAAFTLEAAAPRREDEGLHLELGGPAQGLYLIDLSFDPVYQPLSFAGLVQGLLHVTTSPVVPLHPAFFGQLGGAGATIDLPLAPGVLGGQPGARIVFQAVGLDVLAGGAWTTSSPSALVLLATGL